MLLILLQWLLNTETHQKATKMTLAYDNMCNLDKLKVARNPLPLDKPFDEMWMNILMYFILRITAVQDAKRCTVQIP